MTIRFIIFKNEPTARDQAHIDAYRAAGHKVLVETAGPIRGKRSNERPDFIWIDDLEEEPKP